MDNRGKRQASSIFGGMGFYIALLVCVVAAGVVGYYALISSEPSETIPPATDVDPANPDTAVDPADTDLTLPVGQSKPDLPLPVPDAQELLLQPVIPDLPITVAAPEEIDEEPEPVAVAAPVDNTTVTVPTPSPAKIVSPLAGETVAVFSADHLSYDATLGDWRTHDGIDICAEALTDVAAASAGTVLSVEDDDLMGTTIVIDHHNGYTTTYASLHPETTVQPGDSVSAGEVIGAVGNTSLQESALGAHLHFSVTKDGVSIDPEVYLG